MKSEMNNGVPVTQVDILIVGAGPAGLAAAIAAKEAGVDSLIVLEREDNAGGILRQCIHNGFGLHRFKEELTGPEYAQRDIDKAAEMGIDVRTGVTVLSVDPDKTVTAISRKWGLQVFKAKAVVLAMGCRERPRGALAIPGTRCAGIYSAGTAQKFVNLEGYMPGRRVVILGSGDIGLIMARRMTLQGAKVLACVELMPYSSGLNRNIVQCLQDYNIPLYLSHTVVDIQGRERVTGVTVAKVDENRRPIPGTEIQFDCDTLLLSVGLIPENELTIGAGVQMSPLTNGAVVDDCLQTSVPGIFACGNVLHVHDLADNVTTESERAGAAAATYALGCGAGADAGTAGPCCQLTVSPAGIAGYALPGRITAVALTKLNFRVRRPVDTARVRILVGDEELFAGKVRPFKPSVMESFPLPAKVIQRALDLGVSEIVLSVDPVEEA